MEITEYLAQYPGITYKIGQMGTIKRTFVNKRRYDEALVRWQGIPQDEMARLDQEIVYAEVIKTPSGLGSVSISPMVLTPTAVLYTTVGVLHIIPARDILWVYPSIWTQRMNFIPIDKDHQIRIVERSGEEHVISIQHTPGLSKKEPATEVMQKMYQVIAPVRPGIVFGYSKEADELFHKNRALGIALVDQKSSC